MSNSAAIPAILLMLSVSAANALTITEGAKWPDGDIPVCWEAPKREHAQERDLIRKAVAWTWEKESAVRFTGWQACVEDSPGIRIALETKLPQTRSRGAALDGMPGGMILPSLWSLAALSINLKAPVHEFGHALGFGHEYARPDAPDPDRCSPVTENGEPYVEDDAPLTFFDRDSIMVACIADATVRFSRGTPKLSAADIFGLVGVYGSNPANILDADEAGDRFGASLALKDLNGDGAVDLIVSAPGEDDGAGAAYLFRGDAFSGFRPWGRRVMEDIAPDGLRQSTPATSPDDIWPTGVFGAAPAAARFPDIAKQAEGLNALEHDLDGDGLADLIVGAPQVTRSGAVIVFRGQPAKGKGARFQPWYWFGQTY